MARSIMIQGTMSNAGKSLIAAGLCRIFAQDGYKTAPFKSQNMALNSFITEDGLEMGRAQVVQAEAAGVKPSADMNPILLKPTTDVGSQVIVNGVSIGNMRAKDYFAYKKQLIPQIMEAYKRLDEAYDVIVIEGAGSPAEINLKSDDIVNMGLAAMVDAPVLLAGDIDRGGQLSGEKAPTFHKLLFVHAEDTSAGVLQAAMLQKGFDLILVPSIGEAKRRIFEDKEIELILCDLKLPDGTAMELFHTLRRVAGMFQMKNPPVRLLPFFILTENNDLAMEYEYRHEGVNDYITAPVNIPELIRRVLFFVE